MMSGEWLTDEHISAAQRLLKNQFSHVGGLQSSLLAEANGFESVPSSGVQIHYCKHHWVTSCSIGEHVAVYDSKNVWHKLHNSLTVQLALIYRSAINHGKKGPALQIHIPSSCSRMELMIVGCLLSPLLYMLHLVTRWSRGA